MFKLSVVTSVARLPSPELHAQVYFYFLMRLVAVFCSAISGWLPVRNPVVTPCVPPCGTPTLPERDGARVQPRLCWPVRPRLAPDRGPRRSLTMETFRIQ
jgi:hypothetical protein